MWWCLRSCSGANIDLAAVPARPMTNADASHVTLLSCEAPHLTGATAPRIAEWQPALVKINCAFHGVSDADAVAESLEKAGYQVLGALWRDDNSFSIRSVVQIAPLAHFAPANWDRLNIIGVRDRNLAAAILTLGRLYTGEEARIAELRVANAVRNDTIARLEDAMVSHQPSDIFKLQRS